MKWILIAFILCCFISIQTASRFKPNKACLVRNKYRHERSCSGPRRKFFAFHRIILNCVAVYTKCKRFHAHNEYPTLKKCQWSCGWHMKIVLPMNNTKGSGSGSGSESGSGDEDLGGTPTGDEETTTVGEETPPPEEAA
ncbi:uncharacterized protein LOC132798903 [Drosophila nasuta]|uniref:uncharacterized protein LOC132798903 n=1 Tax=Drosophila nasuta TaxID=42062 RepID=UPI00295EAE3D|nr:uncharacterized protein LOC132798903 [Drosophila nasuta]